MGQRFRRMEDQKLETVLARNQDFAKGGGLKPKVYKFSKIFKLEDVLIRLV